MPGAFSTVIFTEKKITLAVVAPPAQMTAADKIVLPQCLPDARPTFSLGQNLPEQKFNYVTPT